MKCLCTLLVLGCFSAFSANAAEPARILINQLGYEASGPKQAVIQGAASDQIASCSSHTIPARLPLFADDPAFSQRLRVFATDQLNWILGLNPFDSSVLNGVGYNNPGYFFSGMGVHPAAGRHFQRDHLGVRQTPRTTRASLAGYRIR